MKNNKEITVFSTLVKQFAELVAISGGDKDNEAANYVYEKIKDMVGHNISKDDLIFAGSKERMHWHFGKYEFYTINNIWFDSRLVVDLLNDSGSHCGGNVPLSELEFYRSST